jgi:hypothetical protein
LERVRPIYNCNADSDSNADYLWGVDVEEQAVLVSFISFVNERLHVGADSALY